VDPSLFNLIGRLLLERVLRNIVKEPAALDDPHWLLTPFSTFIPDENFWRIFVDRIVSDMRSDAYLETINKDSLEYTLSKAYLKPDLDGSYLIAVLVSYIKPTPSASNFFDKAYAASGPPPTSGYVHLSAPQSDIRAEIVTGMFSPGQKLPAKVPDSDHCLHEPSESDRQKLEEMREERKKNSEWFTLMQVFYATDRHYGDFGTFGAEREKGGTLRYGACEVTIPKKHELGKLESPSFMRLEFRADQRKHITLRQTWKYSEIRFSMKSPPRLRNLRQKTRSYSCMATTCLLKTRPGGQRKLPLILALLARLSSTVGLPTEALRTISRTRQTSRGRLLISRSFLV
jgi:hypothetical protein